MEIRGVKERGWSREVKPIFEMQIQGCDTYRRSNKALCGRFQKYTVWKYTVWKYTVWKYTVRKYKVWRYEMYRSEGGQAKSNQHLECKYKGVTHVGVANKAL